MNPLNQSWPKNDSQDDVAKSEKQGSDNWDTNDGNDEVDRRVGSRAEAPSCGREPEVLSELIGRDERLLRKPRGYQSPTIGLVKGWVVHFKKRRHHVCHAIRDPHYRAGWLQPVNRQVA